MGSDDASTDPASGPPPWLGALAQACGDEAYRYCVGMVGDEGARDVLVRVLAHVLEQEAGGGEADVAIDDLRLTVLAIAHNQCVGIGRRVRRPPTHADRGDGAERRALRALAQLRPIGRDVSILRHGLGLRWDAMQRICGEPPARLTLQVCRGWRRMVHFFEEREGEAPVRRPAGRTLSEAPESWAAIREDARAYVQLRHSLRGAIHGGPKAPPGWVDEVWAGVERLRAEEHEAAERAAERVAAAEAAAEAAAQAKVDAAEKDEAEAERRARQEAERVAKAEQEALALAEEERRRARIRRWLMLGVVLAVLGLVARWMAMR